MSSGLASVRFRGTCFQYCISWLRGAAIESVRFEWWKVFRLHPVYLSISQQKCGLDYAWITDLNGRSGDCCCNAVFRLQQQQENAAIAACLNTNVGKVRIASFASGRSEGPGSGSSVAKTRAFLSPAESTVSDLDPKLCCPSRQATIQAPQ